MSKALVVHFINSRRPRVFPLDSYNSYSDGVLMIKEKKIGTSEWWVCFNMRQVLSWGPEEFEQ